MKKLLCRMFLKLVPIVMIVTVLCLLLTERYVCPINALFGIPCAGCGMTRACKALLRLDLRSAVEYHCLFPVALFWGGYFFLKRFFRFRKKTENVLFLVSMLLFLIRWFYILFFT